LAQVELKLLRRSSNLTCLLRNCVYRVSRPGVFDACMALPSSQIPLGIRSSSGSGVSSNAAEKKTDEPTVASGSNPGVPEHRRPTAQQPTAELSLSQSRSAVFAVHASTTSSSGSGSLGTCGTGVSRRMPRGFERRPHSTMAMAAVAAVVDEPRDGALSPFSRKAAWLLGGLMLVLVGARWGTEVGTSRRIEELEARLKRLEAQQSEWRRRAEREAQCISSVHRNGSGWQFLHADGSEAGFIEVDVRNTTPLDAESVAARRATEAAQCVVNITVAEKTGALQVRRLSGEIADVPLRQSDAAEPVKLASELMRIPAQTLRPKSEAKMTYPELTCNGLASAGWLEVKSATFQQFGTWRAGTELRDIAQLQVLVDSAVKRLSAKSDAGECGMGRLCMSLLAVLAGSTGGVLLGAHAIHSPLLTVLLDVPWRLLMSSGWPIFGMLAQLHLRARERQTAPSNGAAADYFRDLGASLERREAMQSGDTGVGLERHEAARLAYLGAAFLRSDEGRAHASAYVIPGLCALGSQLLSPEVGTPNMPVDNALQQVQGFFRQAVQSIEDLQGTLDSAWPLYSVLHLASLHVGSL